jgi:hypothetical protein
VFCRTILRSRIDDGEVGHDGMSKWNGIFFGVANLSVVLKA